MKKTISIKENENYEPENNVEEFRYRRKEQPTGEEINSIVKFNRLMIRNKIDIESEKIQNQLKITAVLIGISTAVILAAILAAVCYLK